MLLTNTGASFILALVGCKSAHTQSTAKRKSPVSVGLVGCLAVPIICENATFVNPLYLDERGNRVYKTYEKLLKAKGMTVAEFCEKTGIARSTLWRWKNGEIEPRQDTLRKIADVLDVPILTFFVDEGVENGRDS